MMFYKNDIYTEDLKSVFDTNLSLESLKGTNILITGASGLIGTFLVDALMHHNEIYDYNIGIYAMSRNMESLTRRFKTHIAKQNFTIIQHDVTSRLCCNYHFDYIIHAASNAYPQVFSADPVGTIMGNVMGVYNLLEYARQNGARRFLFISSGEVYGQVVEGLGAYKESYSGYIDNTSPRSCYPNGKRAAETLCVSYTKQHAISTVIARPCHTYGPTATANDNRVSTQFINNVLAGNNILMKSEGKKLRSYCYVADCTSAIMIILLHGKIGNAYNIANPNSNVTIREMADIIAAISGKKVIFEPPSEVEQAGYGSMELSVLDASKLESLGWHAKYDINVGLQRTIKVLSSK